MNSTQEREKIYLNHVVITSYVYCDKLKNGMKRAEVSSTKNRNEDILLTWICEDTGRRELKWFKKDDIFIWSDEAHTIWSDYLIQ